MQNCDFESIREAIEGSDSIVVVSHDRPDGDAIGSTLALGEFLENLGKSVTFLNADNVPESIAFFPGSDRIFAPGPSDQINADLLISLDAAGKNRISDRIWESVVGYKALINIDHHISNTRFGDLNYVDAESPATGEIIGELVTHIAGKDAVTPTIATNLYAAISTDTGSFRYPNTTAKTYRIVANLVEAGADVGRLNQLLYENYPRRRVELLNELLNDMRFDFEGRCGSLQLKRDTIERLNIQAGDTEGLIDVIRAIDTVVVAVWFEELPDGKIRVSSRSKTPSADVGKICASFGGGGHTLAAGTRMRGPIENAVERFLQVVGNELDS